MHVSNTLLRLKHELKTGKAKAVLSIPDGLSGSLVCPNTAEVTAIHVRKLSDPAYLRALVEKKLATVLGNLNSKGYLGNLRALPIAAMSPAQHKAYNSHRCKISPAKIIGSRKPPKKIH